MGRIPGDPMDGKAYWEGYHAGMNKHPWSRVPYEPGSRHFHKWIEGHGDGMKAHALVKHSQRH